MVFYDISREKESRNIHTIRRTFSHGQDDKRETKDTCTKTSYRDTQRNNAIGQNG